MNRFVTFAAGIIFFLFLPFFVNQAYAVTYSLVAPEGPLRRGDQVKFTIYIDTEGSTVTSGIATQVGMSYETQYLQYISTTPGTAMNSIEVAPTEDGKFLLSGTNSSGFKGNDVFAYITFKIIAEAPGETRLCALWTPQASPTPTPTSPPGATATPGPTSPPGATATPGPQPTELPRSGSTETKQYASVIGGFFVITGAALLLVKKLTGF